MASFQSFCYLFSLLLLAQKALSQTTGPSSSSSSNYCDSLTDCLSKASKAEQDCRSELDSQSSANNSTGRPAKAKNDKACSPEIQASIKDNMKKLAGKKQEQINQFIKCVGDRKSQSFDVTATGPKQKSTCERASSFTTNSTDSTFFRAARAAGPGSKGKGWAKGQGKGKGKGKQKSCMADVHQSYNRCKRLEKCCSETTICKLQFELSSLHDEMRKIQLDSATKQHDCVKAKLSSRSA